ncbi:MAG: cysteine--tRNA ligase [Patescibacteria group bacterium]
MALKLYNTLTRKKEEFNPSKDGVIRLYTCGPTVYDHAHIGNLRSYIFADVLRRVLKHNGYAVRWIMNITDIDDKTIKRTVDEFGSQATPENLKEYTDRYIKSFLDDLKKLNIPTDEPDITLIRVSDKIEEIKTFIKELKKLGYAYKTEDGVYFNIEKYQEKFGDYGCLVGESFLNGKKTGTRVKVDEYDKESVSDFALWKGRDQSDGKIFWSDPELGDGRPGWHVECSVINREGFNGKTTDIHTGGVDLIFPHHTNEIAQSQALLGKDKFVRYWLHNDHLLVGGKKMAKSEKNFFTLKDLESDLFRSKGKYKDKENMISAGLAFRHLTLQTNYGVKMNFTKTALLSAKRNLYYLAEKYKKYENPPWKFSGLILDNFINDLNENFNTAGALAHLWEAIPYPDDRVDTMLEIFGIKDDLLKLKAELKPLEEKNISIKIWKLVNEREKYRTNKQFVQSDRLRKEINELGYELKDTPDGPKIWPKNLN